MPRKVITLDICDVCMHTTENEIPATWNETISIGKLTREFMLCDKHVKQFIGDLPKVLEAYGTRVSHQPAKPKVMIPKKAKDDANKSNANILLPTKASKITHKSKANPLACPDCEFVAHNGTGFSAHRRAKHPDEMREAS